MSTVVTGPAEQLRFEQVAPAPPKPRARRVSPHRAWARAERLAWDAFQAAKESGDTALVERTRRAWSESWRSPRR